jgi:NhaA family Na+:H+ antiporter
MSSSEPTGPVATVAAGVDALGEFFRDEQTGGRLLLVATAVALLWANLAGDSYETVWSASAAIGPAWLHLDLTLGDWAADGLLALFFFVAGLELKRELTVGELSRWRAAALPVFAAVGGMIAPALVALAVSGGAAVEGGAWAIPVATDIAFALGVLSLAAAALPSGVRVLLLSIAVIDDLIAITLIALVFTDDLAFGWLLGSLALATVYRLALRRGTERPALLWLVAVAVWVCVHASGVHATVAGILLALLTPVHSRPGQGTSAARRFGHRLHPVSAGVAVPVFALAAAGIPLGALTGITGDSIALGVFFGLLLGKVIGILGGAGLSVALRVGALPEGVSWRDAMPVAMLGAVGYTVSLLIARIALDEPAAQERVAAAVLAASVVASAAALTLLRPGRRHSA